MGKEEPEAILDFQADKCLNFEYHYDILPEGLIPRFIVRSHILSRDNSRWRSGVILSREKCTALVTSLPSDNKVVVRVKGSDSGARQNLLAIIRYDLDQIHDEFNDRLGVEAKVPLLDHPAHSIEYDKLVAFEKRGVSEFPEFVMDEVVYVKVSELLNGVDLENQREESSEILTNPLSVFFSYSHKDEELRDELEIHLKLLKRQGVISTWHDRKIVEGQDWEHEIDQHLKRARIVLLLVSSDFIASDYCWDIEVKEAIERHKSKEAVVVPVILRPVDYDGAPFKEGFDPLPENKQAVTTWDNRDEAWTDVARGIRRVAEAL